MPLTTSGRLVKPGGTEHPSLVDIAVGLSRQPRFAGHCRRWWSVLDHTLFCDELVKAETGVSPFLPFGEQRLAVLLHDAHEAITGDVPTDCKEIGLKKLQGDLDISIFGAYFPGEYETYRYEGYRDVVKRIDRRALCAEARVVGPPATPERTLELFGVCEETAEDVTLLEELLTRFTLDRRLRPLSDYGHPPFQVDQQDHPGVQEYLHRMLQLL